MTLADSTQPDITLNPPSPVQPSIIRRPSNRRHPSSSHLHHIRERSTSTSSSIGPGRTRAPTLAGQALEHAHEAVKAIQEQDVQSEVKEKKLARTFLALRLPSRQTKNGTSTSTGHGTVPAPSRKGKERAVNGNGNRNGHGDARPSLSTSSSRSSVDSFKSSGRSTPTMIRDGSRSESDEAQLKGSRPAINLERTDSLFSSRSMKRVGSNSNGNGPVITTSFVGSLHRNDSFTSKGRAQGSPESIPFYISPIHHPSTNPRFLHLEEGDFAPWLTTEESASSQAILEVWYEDEDADSTKEGQEKQSKWRKADNLGGEIDLTRLRRLENGTKLGDNAILLTLGTDPDKTYYLDPNPDHGSANTNGVSRTNDAVERSRRETRMKKGVGLGGLHQYVESSSLFRLFRQRYED